LPRPDSHPEVGEASPSAGSAFPGSTVLRWGSLVLGAIVVLLWLVAALQHPAPALLARGAVIAALLVSGAWGGRALRQALAGKAGRRRALVFLLPALLFIALAVRFVGLGHEVEGRYYLDEGTYYHHASEIDAGKVLRLSFVYPHLLYYLDAVVLWLAGLFPAAAAGFGRLYGVTEPLALSWLLLRGVVALLSALTLLPVFALGRRLAGPFGGALAALLLAFQPLYNEGSHLNTCDVPSAFFAAVCLALVAGLLERESASGYVLAGIASGLAAAAKYPAGLVAVAIVGAWAYGRIARRPFNLGLLWAGLASLATFVGVIPSLLVYPRAAFLGERGMLFGAHQYGQGGWLGVTPDSNLAFYAGNLAESFGWAALILGLLGLAALPREARRRLLGLLPFPLLYLALIVSMSMVVKRNLYPVLPPLAAFLGAGLAAGAGWLARRREKPGLWLPLLAGGLALATLIPAIRATIAQDLSLASPSTREMAAAWIRSHLPPGASLAKESYTPDFAPGELAVRQVRFAGRIPIPELRRGYDYVLLASAAYARFNDPAALSKPHQREVAGRYREIFAGFPEVARWTPDARHQGPILRLFRVPPDPAACRPEAALPSADAFVPEEAMQAGPRWPVRYSRPGQWARFALCLPAGSYGVGLEGSIGERARIRAVDGTGKALGDRTMAGAGPAGPFVLPATARVLLYVELEPGSRLKGLAVRPWPAPGAGGPRRAAAPRAPASGRSRGGGRSSRSG
jgi:hypothetical protein